MRQYFVCVIFMITCFCTSCHTNIRYDLVLQNGLIYDGSGGEPFTGDVAINDDTIAAISRQPFSLKGKRQIDVGKKIIAPGFINMLSWATESLLEDGKSESDIRQGLTLEVLGEGWSMGPFNEQMKKSVTEMQRDIKYKIKWNTLREYLLYLEKKGISCNVASFVGATTIRSYVMRDDNRVPSPEELNEMKLLVRQAMKDGALGLSTALVYPPASFASTNELIELSKEVKAYDGLYISHIRNEGNGIFNALDEFINISKTCDVRSEIYHLKITGKDNWGYMDSVIRKIEIARQQGLNISANMYVYTAAGAGLNSCIPPWIQEGSMEEFHKRLNKLELRKKMESEINRPGKGWDNFYYAAGSPENILLMGFKNDSLKGFVGKSLAEVAVMFKKSAPETIMDLLIADRSRVNCVYFLMNEQNVKKILLQPWVSFCSDEGSYANKGVFLQSNPHPRAYGNFARLLSKYVRDDKAISLSQAIHRLTKLPATNLHILKRGELKIGNYADIIVFDTEKIQEHATYEKPHQYATGMIHVFVNGKQVLKNGEHTGATPGMAVFRY
jgi:N-acyl-D-amino-acid deacylase